MSRVEPPPPQDRALRVALLWNRSIVKDEVLYDPHDVTVGDSERCTFAVKTDLGPNLTLFRYTPDGFLLRLVPGMTGRVVVRGRSALVTQTLSSYRNEPVEVLVSAGDWGILGLGPVAAYFQFLPAHKKPPRSIFAADRDIFQSMLVALVLTPSGGGMRRRRPAAAVRRKEKTAAR